MRVLVTGGAGYIGSVTSQLLEVAGHDVVVLDDLSTGHRDALSSAATFVEGSLLDSAAVDRSLVGVDAVIHFAGKSLVGESMEQPDLYWRVNRDGSQVLIDSMKKAGVTRIVFSSTAATYGEPSHTPILEGDPTLPTNVYGHTKLAVEALLASEPSLTSISLRYFNVAGALDAGLLRDGTSGVVGERHATETHLIPNILRWVRAGEAIKIFGGDWPTPDGTCIRDYIHVVDLAEAHLAALARLWTLPPARVAHHEIINLGSGRGYSVLEVIAAVEQELGLSTQREVLERRAGDPAMLVAGVELAQQILGWSPRRGMSQIVRDAALS